MKPEPGNTPELSIVIPLYCEGEHIEEVLRTVARNIQGMDVVYEMILIDDGSTDDTWEKIAAASQADGRIRTIKLSRNFGKEAALCAGLDKARGRAVILMDGDLQHPPELIPDMVKVWRETRAEVIEAVKVYRGEESLFKKVSANLFYSAMRLLTGYDFSGASDYKLLDRKVVNAWLQYKERNLFFRGVIASLGYKHVKISFTVPERSGGQSKWSTFRLFRLAVTGVTAFSSKPLYLIAILGLLFAIAAIVITCIEFYQKAIGFAVSGFATVIILQLIIGGLLLFVLALLGIYIGNIYEEVKGRPRYLVSKTTNLDDKNDNEF